MFVVLVGDGRQSTCRNSQPVRNPVFPTEFVRSLSVQEYVKMALGSTQYLQETSASLSI